LHRQDDAAGGRLGELGAWLRPLRKLGINEVSRQKGHSYFAIFYILEREELQLMSAGCWQEAVTLFFVRIQKEVNAVLLRSR
jgi:hypothetical protein